MSIKVPDFTPHSSYVYEESPSISREEYLRELKGYIPNDKFDLNVLQEYNDLFHEMDFLVTYLREGTKVVINSKSNTHYEVLCNFFPKLDLDIWTSELIKKSSLYEHYPIPLNETNTNTYENANDVIYISYSSVDETELIQSLKPRAALLMMPSLTEDFTYFKGYILAPYLISGGAEDAYCYVQLERNTDGSYDQYEYNVDSLKSRLSYRDLAVKKQIVFYNNLNRSSVVFSSLTVCTLEICRILWLFWRYLDFFQIGVKIEASPMDIEILIKYIEREIDGFSISEYSKNVKSQPDTGIKSTPVILDDIAKIQAILLNEEELVTL